MVNTQITITHSGLNSGSPIKIMGTAVVVAFNKRNDKTPNANYDQYPADIQNLSRENVKYTLQNCKIDKGDLTYSLLLDLFNLEHNPSNPLILNVLYNSKYLVDSLGSTTDIPVAIDGGLSVTFSTIDSKDASVPVVNIPLIEV
jgi:hypothetical protein